MVWLLEISELLNLKHMIVNSHYLYCTSNSVYRSESEYLSDRKVVQPSASQFSNALLPLTRSCSVFQNYEQIVSLLRMESAEHPWPASVGSSCSEPLAWAAMAFFPFSVRACLPRSPCSGAKAARGLPSSYRLGTWLHVM